MSESDLSSLQNPENIKIESDDWFEKIPALLKNYKLYINKQSQKVFNIIVSYGTFILSFMGALTVMGCFLRHVYEPYLKEKFERTFCIEGQLICLRGFVMPRFLRDIFEKT